MRPVDQTAAPVVESFRVGEHMLDPARLSERRAVWEVLCNHVQRIAVRVKKLELPRRDGAVLRGQQYRRRARQRDSE